MTTLLTLPRLNPKSDEGTCAIDLLAQVPLERIEEVVRSLKQRHSPAEIRSALIERIARAPLSDFQALKAVYMAHCADVIT
jgi:hypothetical protein